MNFAGSNITLRQSPARRVLKGSVVEIAARVRLVLSYLVAAVTASPAAAKESFLGGYSGVRVILVPLTKIAGSAPAAHPIVLLKYLIPSNCTVKLES